MKVGKQLTIWKTVSLEEIYNQEVNKYNKGITDIRPTKSTILKLKRRKK